MKNRRQKTQKNVSNVSNVSRERHISPPPAPLSCDAVIGEQSAGYPRCYVRASNQRLMTISERNTR